MCESLEELKSIINNAPDDATHIDIDGDYIKSGDDPCDFYFDGMCWVELYGAGVMRSLSDIKRIIELMELNQNMHTTVAGYLSGDDWSHWSEFNAGKFKL